MQGTQFIEIALVVLGLGILARIVVTDFLQYKIYNVDILAFLACAVGLIVADDGLRPPLGNIAAGTILFSLGVVFWQLKWIGAGDAKLLGACGFLAGFENLFVLSWLTLVLSIVFLFAIRVLMPMPMLPAPLHERISIILAEKKIPYGVPLAFAMAVVVLRDL